LVDRSGFGPAAAVMDSGHSLLLLIFAVSLSAWLLSF
jgi:hypothetical protein